MSGHLAQQRLTGVRQELKYLISPSEGPQIKEAIAKRLSSKIVNGADHSWRISIYLDVPEFEIAKRGLTHGSQTTKLRVKNYYLLNGTKAVYDDNCWLEVKTRAGSMVEKSRFTVSRKEVEKTLLEGPQLSLNPDQREAQEVFESVREGRILKPLFVAHYCRWTFQDSDSRLRITLDNGASYHLPPRGIFTEQVPICSRAYLPPPLLVEKRWIVEVKSIGLIPEWIEETLEGRSPVEYSKFVSGVNAVAALGIIGK